MPREFRRLLTEQERAEWAAFTRQVRAIAGKDPLADATAEPAPSAAPSTGPPRSPKVPPSRAPLASLAVGLQPGGVDNATWSRLRSGRMAPARTLDLHGRTAQRAFVALSHFLRSAQADGVRVVEVITGRGSGETGGVIRRELPLWLNLPELRPLVLGMTYPHALNQGAVRILLRRTR